MVLLLAAMPVHFVATAVRKTARADGAPTRRRYNLWRRLVLWGLIATTLGLAATGFWPALTGERLSGLLLMAHCTVAPAFAVCLTLVVLTFAGSCRFEPHDMAFLKALPSSLHRGGPAGRFGALQKIAFWLIAVSGLGVILSMVLSMTPLASTDELGWLADAHRYCALAMSATMLVHAYVSVGARRGHLSSIITGKVSDEWARRHHPLWKADGTDADNAA